MKTLIGLAAGIAVVAVGHHLEGSAPPATPVSAHMANEVSRYSLLIAGSPAGCSVTKGRKLSEAVSEIDLGEGCGKAYARLGDIAVWRDGPDGDVAFATEDGRTLVRFASGDGVAYESYRPAVPFISLVAEK